MLAKFWVSVDFWGPFGDTIHKQKLIVHGYFQPPPRSPKVDYGHPRGLRGAADFASPPSL